MFWEFAKKLCKSKWCGHGESISHSWDEINYEEAFLFSWACDFTRFYEISQDFTRFHEIFLFSVFRAFWAYVGQPHAFIDWATSMPFASINPTYIRTNLRNFREKISRIGDFEKWAFFESAILNFFFEKKKFFFASFPWKSAQIYMVEWMGQNFNVFPGF